MLSAVAARKARLAQTQAQSPSSSAPPTAAPPPSIPPPEQKVKGPSSAQKPSSQKPPSKRKLSSYQEGSTKKKKTQNRKSSPARYFAQPTPSDGFKLQDDVIAVDESDSESSESSQSSSSDDESPLRIQPTAKTAAKRRSRAWSPSAPLSDSSDEDEDENGTAEPLVLDTLNIPPSSRPLEAAPARLSTFKPILQQNVLPLDSADVVAGDCLGKRALLLLKQSETIALLGVYSLTILRGTISLAGVSLQASATSHRVFAPRSSPIPVIQCQRAPSKNTQSPSLPANILPAAQGYDAVISIQEMVTGVEGLGKICRTFDGAFAPSRWHRSQLQLDLGLDSVYFLSHQTPDTLPYTIPASWDAAIPHGIPLNEEDPLHRLVCFVKGPKNAGKSTFAKLLLNRLLSRYRRVAYLECDLGQSEFTPGGMVSLSVLDQPVFGPPFTHPSIPHASHYVGATSPRTSPSHYLDCIQALMQVYHLDVQNATLDEDALMDEENGPISTVIPLVVNTMGWTRGLGADLTRKVEEITEPSHVFSFDAATPEDDFHPSGPLEAPYENGSTDVHLVKGIPPSLILSNYTAADHRNLSVLSYLHAVFPELPLPTLYTSTTACTWNTSLPLCAQPPFEVDCQTAVDRIILSGAGTEDVVPSEVQRTLNGSLVALVSCEPGTLDDSAPTSVLPYTQGASPPSPHTSRCLGLALVRALSLAHAPRLHLITPVPPSLLGGAHVLVMGELQLPVWGMLDFRTLDDGGDVAGCERGRVPFLRWGKGEGAGGERRRVRRNLMRRGQM